MGTTSVAVPQFSPGIALHTTGPAGGLGSAFSTGLGSLARGGAASDAGGAASDVASGSGREVGLDATKQAGFERRVAWIEEDVAVLHRRLRDECVDNVGGASGDAGLRAMVARLDGELAAERRARESMGSRMNSLEQAIKQERKERETHLQSFSSELEATMRGLIARIDEGLSAGAAGMRDRTDVTEVRLRSLIQRVDEGLSAGAVALQDTLSNQPQQNRGPFMESSRAQVGRSSSPNRFSAYQRASEYNGD